MEPLKMTIKQRVMALEQMNGDLTYHCVDLREGKTEEEVLEEYEKNHAIEPGDIVYLINDISVYK